MINQIRMADPTSFKVFICCLNDLINDSKFDLMPLLVEMAAVVFVQLPHCLAHLGVKVVFYTVVGSK